MLNLLRCFLILLYRIWFYVLTALPIIVFFPVLLVLTSSERFYSQFFWVARNLWAAPILYGMGFHPRFIRAQAMEKGKSYMLVANHTSMADIMLMLRASKNPFVFVGKKELVKMPLFGFFYKKVCIMVDRGSARSRSAVYMRAKKRLDQGLSICIFPEGGVPEQEGVVLDEFKDGAFKLAIDYQIPVVPMVFKDNKRRFPYEFCNGSPGIMRVEVHPFLETKGMDQSHKEELKKKTREIILSSLLHLK